ncbi:MAG TPA: DUF2231 domain-containing protein [Vitreimonas sp.]|uniref:DUF2231 domain-containing protein n=1 Tax=Vitreimonas sp. TaxID=3069702 RepID=UPI002D2BBF8B|nr:DUF2231 domain-containing protein [Vitreimonas sp.]HYD88978.1 DUF2231 domain-containing protein [Vitreimonas sp.]
MRLHPLHPMLVHLPLAGWVLTPLCDAAAAAVGEDFFSQAAALMAAVGVVGGAIAAMAGALDYERAHRRAPKLVLAHASLMGAAWTLAAGGLFGRLTADYAVLTPPPAWAVACSAAALASMLLGAWCGGELVYGRGVNVRALEDS